MFLALVARAASSGWFLAVQTFFVACTGTAAAFPTLTSVLDLQPNKRVHVRMRDRFGVTREDADFQGTTFPCTKGCNEGS
jgi:hypothetical protein